MFVTVHVGGGVDEPTPSEFSKEMTDVIEKVFADLLEKFEGEITREQ